MKFCKDCEFHKSFSEWNPKTRMDNCYHPEIVKQDFVTGGVYPQDCAKVRSGKCGPEGMLFKQKAPVKIRESWLNLKELIG